MSTKESNVEQLKKTSHTHTLFTDTEYLLKRKQVKKTYLSVLACSYTSGSYSPECTFICREWMSFLSRFGAKRKILVCHRRL